MFCCTSDKSNMLPPWYTTTIPCAAERDLAKTSFLDMIKDWNSPNRNHRDVSQNLKTEKKNTSLVFYRI